MSDFDNYVMHVEMRIDYTMVCMKGTKRIFASNARKTLDVAYDFTEDMISVFEILAKECVILISPQKLSFIAFYYAA